MRDYEKPWEADDSVVMFGRGLSVSRSFDEDIALKRSEHFSVRVLYDCASVMYGLASNAPVEVANVFVDLAPRLPRGDAKKMRVNNKLDMYGIFRLDSAQMMEEGEVKKGNGKIKRRTNRSLEAPHLYT